MKITPDTASTLGAKLATLDLTEVEGALLCSLLADGDLGTEVSGFSSRRTSDARSMFETFRKQNLPQVLGPLPDAWLLEIEGYISTSELWD